MMNRDLERIGKLLERFFEGETSGEEERLLREFFASDAVPAAWEGYRQLFGYLAAGLAADLSAAGSKRAVMPKRRRYVAGAIAAAAVLGVGICLAVLLLQRPDEAGLGEFEGSYIVRNGTVITDPELVMPEIEATLREAQALQAGLETPTGKTGQEATYMILN